MRALPRSLVPLPDETLTGFVLRLSHRLGTTPGEIAVRTGLPSRLPLGFLYHLDDEHLTGFARATQLAPAEVSGMLLAPFGERYGPLNPAVTPRRTPARMIYDNPWVLTRSTRYCPHCLAGDGTAIQDLHGGAWRRLWRLPVTFLCLRHQRLLQHQCPGCATPAQFAPAVNAIARLTDHTLHPWQCRFTTRPTPLQQSGTACAVDLTRLDPPLAAPDAVTMTVLLRVQQQLIDLLLASGPETAMSAGAPVSVLYYFADLRATVAMIFRSWPVAREYASTPCLADALDVEYASRVAQAEPLFNTPGKKKTSKPYTVPPTECLATGAALDIAANLLDTHDPGDARSRLAPLVQRLREVDLALSTWLRRPSWISVSLRQAVMDLPTGRRAAA
jgi:hypothetical protein